MSVTKQQLLAMIDCAMGGHIAEEMIMGDNNLTSGCSSDLKSATDIAIKAVRQFGMFGEQGSSFLSTSKDDTSDEFNSKIDARVQEILKDSHARVTKLLSKKEDDL